MFVFMGVLKYVEKVRQHPNAGGKREENCSGLASERATNVAKSFHHRTDLSAAGGSPNFQTRGDANVKSLFAQIEM